jgi:hypothetical protein
MKNMKAISTISPTTLLKTNQPVIPINRSTWTYLPEVEAALHRGVAATPDDHRPEFFEIELGDTWYYVHVPSRLRAVYLVAAQSRVMASQSGLLAQQTAC